MKGADGAVHSLGVRHPDDCWRVHASPSLRVRRGGLPVPGEDQDDDDQDDEHHPGP
jgi:hypothetical protein